MASAPCTLPKRVLFICSGVEGTPKEIASALAKSATEQNGGRIKVCVDCVRNGYEGLQQIERNEYDAIVLPKQIGTSYPSMQGLEFIKIAKLINSERACPAIIILGESQTEASFMSKIAPANRDLISHVVRATSVTLADCASALRSIFCTVQELGELQGEGGLSDMRDD